ncbi:hypothetical protein M422DRAFT_255042 [Sphaerobolus stellatus SS14]|uniref:F-box domain-containing protein n=1 Tax=Sphaerobolus stellatus (strain SS14) TaxID=990650 RepID=A0A0C9VTZ8_SPHS4|nr:hypothetical protein M422DRAFT_255042 [Sphaerobolus stellatus SS14]
MKLPYELLSGITAFIDGDIPALYSCMLSCRALHDAAIPLLYKRIHVSPPKIGLAWQVLEDTPGRKPFATARLPTHTSYVEEFTLDGYITKVRPSRQIPIPVVDKIPDTLTKWPNLRKVTITPKSVTGSSVRNIIASLKNCKSLKSITVNGFAMTEECVSDLVALEGLETLVLHQSTGAFFLRICDWVEKIKNTLVTLNLMGDCGSLTPGILRKLTPHLMHVHSLAIGLSYSLTNRDVFNCLGQLPELQSLRIQYYYQQSALPDTPGLSSLRHLIVLHPVLTYKEDAEALSSWIRRLTSSSPLESLETIVPNYHGPNLCFDGLVTHLAHRHRTTLTSLWMPAVHLRSQALESLLKNCSRIRHITLNISFNTLRSFPNMSNESKYLKSVGFQVCDHPHLIVDQMAAKKLFDRIPQLRKITVNWVTWKGEWVLGGCEGSASPEFIISLVQHAGVHSPSRSTLSKEKAC